MLTLSNLKYDVKTLIRTAGLVIGAVLLIYILFKAGIFIKEIVSPTPPKAPDVKFGKLPSIAFPQSVEKNALNYRVDTLSGNLPNFSHLANVYMMDEPKAELLALDRASDKAFTAGFKDRGKKISSYDYVWQDKNGRTFSYNILTSNFSLKSPLSTTSAIFVSDTSETDAINKATSFLNSLGLLHEDIDTEKTTTFLYSIANNSLVEATSLSSTQLISVHFFQKDIGDLPVFYPGGKSTMSVAITQGNRVLEVSSADFPYQKPNLNKKTTYSIKTGNEAFEELKKGKAYIIKYNPSENPVLIKNLYLGYYIGREKQNYLMPIYVFEGNSFLAYVSAVRDEWIGN